MTRATIGGWARLFFGVMIAGIGVYLGGEWSTAALFIGLIIVGGALGMLAYVYRAAVKRSHREWGRKP